MAKTVDIGYDGLIFHPYLNGELIPYANPNLCADFVGVRASHTKAHFTRTVLEDVVMSMLDCKLALENLNIEHQDSEAIIGGGGKFQISPNTTATVIFPKQFGRTYKLKNKFSNTILGTTENGEIIYKIGSGNYYFCLDFTNLDK